MSEVSPPSDTPIVAAQAVRVSEGDESALPSDVKATLVEIAADLDLIEFVAPVLSLCFF